MASPQFQKCTLETLSVLQQLSLTTFVAAFGHQNSTEDMKVYCQQAFSLEKLKEELNNEHSIFYFLKSGEIIVGYFKLNIETAQSESIEGGLEIERIYLLSPYQGLGFGQIMFNKVYEIARKMNKQHLWLGVWEKNEGAIRFYERNGFRQFGKHAFLLGKDLQMDLLMELILMEGEVGSLQ